MKFNLVVDGNFFLMRNVFPLHNSNTLFGNLASNLLNGFDRQVSLFPFNQIFFVSDSKYSWRKTHVNASYKANRKKKEEIDWNFVFTCYSEFKSKISKTSKITHLESDGIEGDDWIAGIVKESNRRGISCLVISSDEDLLQLLKWSFTPNVINIQYRDSIMQEKVWLPKGYNIFINSLQKTPVDLFALDWRHDFLELIKKFKKYTVVEVNPQQALFCKIVQGDKGDNIESLFISTTKNGKPRGIGDSGAEKIWQNYIANGDEFVDYHNQETLEYIIDLVVSYKKLENTVTHRTNILNKLNENVKLITLVENYMPEEYTNILEKSITENIKQ
jgi:5'-3' exonuclease